MALEAVKEGMCIGLKIGGAVWAVTACVVLMGVVATIAGVLAGANRSDDNDNNV